MTQTIIIHNAQVFVAGDTTHQWVVCANGKISGVGQGELDIPEDAIVIDAEGKRLLPGFIDVHVHGGNNVDSMDATPEALQTMAQFYARHGVTSFLATTWTDSPEKITAALENVKHCTGRDGGRIEKGATLRGVHLEGPYLNPHKSGAQNPAYVKRADRDEATAWLDMDVIRLLSIAPEYAENRWLIEECVRRSVTVSAAHTNANYDDIVAAVKLGLTHSTHTFNAMTGLHHRKPGVVGAAMSIPQINCEIIADNIHVHPAAMRLLWNAKNFQNVILITDAMRAAGMPDGEYPVDERTTYVRDGVAQLEDGTLAGSTLTMNNALKNFVAATQSPLESIYETTSLTPAEAIGIEDVTGSIEVGKDADLVLLDTDYNVHLTVAQGRMVYQA